jgi:hypothetical protein
MDTAFLIFFFFGDYISVLESILIFFDENDNILILDINFLIFYYCYSLADFIYKINLFYRDLFI